jgi:urea transporter
MAIGGVLYAPTLRTILIGAACAFLFVIAGGVLAAIFSPLGLPVLTVPFCIVTKINGIQAPSFQDGFAL